MRGFINRSVDVEAPPEEQTRLVLGFEKAIMGQNVIAHVPGDPRGRQADERGELDDVLAVRWTYRSFRHDPIVVDDGKVAEPLQLALPWSPPGVLEADVADSGEVSGRLTFGRQAVLAVTGRITSARAPLPAAIELVAEGLGSAYRIKGFFVPETDHIVGTVVCLANDLAKQPVGTAGAFVLFPPED